MASSFNRSSNVKITRTFHAKYVKYEDLIGRGSFGLVYRCINHETGVEYAVKCVHAKGNDPVERFEILKEEAICKRLNHEYVVKFYEGFFENGWRYMVFELIEGRDIVTEICARDHYSERDARNYIHQILNAVDYVHSCGIVHRDIKPTNILLRPSTNKIKLIDFGLAREMLGDERNVFGQTGCPKYIAPEVLRDEGYGKPVDVWACGVVLYNLVFGMHPFSGRMRNVLYHEIKRGSWSPPPFCVGMISPHAVDFIERLMNPDQYRRFTARRALRHPFITNARLSSTWHLQTIVYNLKSLRPTVVRVRRIQPIDEFVTANDSSDLKLNNSPNITGHLASAVELKTDDEAGSSDWSGHTNFDVLHKSDTGSDDIDNTVVSDSDYVGESVNTKSLSVHSNGSDSLDKLERQMHRMSLAESNRASHLQGSEYRRESHPRGDASCSTVEDASFKTCNDVL